MQRFWGWFGVGIALFCAVGCGGSGNDAETVIDNRPITPKRYVVVNFGEVQPGDLALAMNNRQTILRRNATGKTFLFTPDGTTTVISEDPQVWASGLNDRGQVVGWMPVAGSPRHAFLWQNGQFTDLGTLTGGAESYATHINNQGEIVGSSHITPPTQSESPVYRAFLYRDGKMAELIAPEGLPSTSAWKINDSGQVLGFGSAPQPNGIDRGEHIIWQDGRAEVLRAPGVTRFYLQDINDEGIVSGGVSGMTDFYAGLLRLSDMQITNITAQGGESLFVAPGDLNNRGQTLGNFGIGQGAGVAGTGLLEPYLYSEGVTYNVEDLIGADSGWKLSGLTLINDDGYIVAYGRQGSAGENHLLLLTPVFE